MTKPGGGQPLFWSVDVPDPHVSDIARVGMLAALTIGVLFASTSATPCSPQDGAIIPNPRTDDTRARLPSRVDTQIGEILLEPDLIVRQAKEHLTAGRIQEARARLREGLKAYPNHAPMHQLMGIALSALREDAEALRHLKRAAELWPDHPVYWINLAVFSLRQAQIGGAEEALRKSLDASPSPAAYNLLGLIRLEQNASEEALNLFMRSLELDSEDVRARYYLGLAHQSLAKNDSALALYKEVLQRAPRDFHTHLQIGKLYLKRGLRKQALEHLQSAQELRPGNPELYQPLSEAYLGTGDLESALAAAQRAVELRPTDRQAHYVLGMVLARLGRTEDATKEFHISEGLPRAPEPSALERWREIAGQTPVANEANP